MRVVQAPDSIPCFWKLPFSRSELTGIIERMLEAAGQSGAGVDLLVLSDADMEVLHGRSLGREGPTNILSFPSSAGAVMPGESAPFLGDLVLSADTLRRECFLYGQDPAEHCLRLLAHGLAHLLGFEHGQAMQALTDALENAAAAPVA